MPIFVTFYYSEHIGVKWYLIVVLTFISLVTKDVKHLFIYLLAMCTSSLGLPWWFSGKESICQCRVWSLMWEDPLEKEMATHSSIVFLPGKSHGQRNLEGYSPWGLKRVGYNLATKQQPQLLLWKNTNWNTFLIF